MIVIITGRSGSGKTSLALRLREHVAKSGPLVSVTTRSPRPSDSPGEYFYVSEEEFDRMVKNGEFLWVVGPHGKRYGTRKNDVAHALQDTALHVAILEPKVLAQLAQEAQLQGQGKRVIFFYLDIDDEEVVRERLLGRADLSREEIESRIIECRPWKTEAQHSGVDIIYLDALQPAPAVFAEMLVHLKNADGKN